MISDSRSPALECEHVSHRYGDREALSDLSLEVGAGEMFAVLGPNGSGKSTMFRLISTIAPVQTGAIRVCGFDVASQQAMVRRQIGVVFQNPAVDKQLTILENIHCHAHLYGITGLKLRRRAEALLERFGIADRANDMVHTLSGGTRRKVELAKALLPEPSLLILDEPSTGLDVAARIELWSLLQEMRSKQGLSILLTTHLMDEADRCNRLAILDTGKLVALGTPAELKQQIGGEVISFSGPFLDQLRELVEHKLLVAVKRVGDELRIERLNAHSFVPHLIAAVPGMIESVSVGRPTLDDVFVHLTGRRLNAE